VTKSLFLRNFSFYLNIQFYPRWRVCDKVWQGV
jgi:hypothetical protein